MIEYLKTLENFRLLPYRCFQLYYRKNYLEINYNCYEYADRITHQLCTYTKTTRRFLNKIYYLQSTHSCSQHVSTADVAVKCQES